MPKPPLPVRHLEKNPAVLARTAGLTDSICFVSIYCEAPFVNDRGRIRSEDTPIRVGSTASKGGDVAPPPRRGGRGELHEPTGNGDGHVCCERPRQRPPNARPVGPTGGDLSSPAEQRDDQGDATPLLGRRAFEPLVVTGRGSPWGIPTWFYLFFLHLL